MSPRIRSLALLLAVAMLAGCATPRPILSGRTTRPDDAEVAEAVRGCAEADRRIRDSSRERLERAGYLVGAVVFAALAGAGAGAVIGGQTGDVGDAALVGGGVGAGLGLIGGPWFVVSKLERDSKIRIGSCLRERGYEVVGWE